ncbi:MAG: GNAT family N-acetyltransferase [Candidatus Bathyarchaeota archaeon]|nr:GNAT family N-acetyltransferase [Candidatus Bathyarchaeota archaeon]
MMHVEKMSADDFPFAVQLSNTMSWNMTVEDFEFIMKLEPEGCFVLFSGAERLGICTAISFGNLGWIGNLIVKEAYRKEGAGSLLLKQAIAYLRSKQVATIGLYAYPHLTSFYTSFGFKPDIEFLVLQGEPAAFPPEDSTARRAQNSDIQKIIEFDRRFLGADRQKLLEAIILKAENLCYIVPHSNGISGYVAAKVYGADAEVGPLVCLANHVEAAEKLLKTVLSSLRGLNVSVCLPKKEAELLDLLHAAGFREKFRVVRMFLGSALAKKCIYIAESLERG